MDLVRIIPPPAEAGRSAKTQGTRVLLADGSELKGVTRLVLIAEPNDLWRAEITCRCEAPDIGMVQATIQKAPKPNLLKRLWDWLFDDGEYIEVTHLSSGAREFYRGKATHVFPLD